MRKLLITFVLLGLAINSYSQLKFFLPDSNAYFSISSYKFWFQGDTIINNKKYKKVFQQNYDTIADFNKAIYYAGVREDTINEKIICIQKDDGIERLLADFSLNPSDTTSVYSFWPFGSPEKKLVNVKNVDSIQINDFYRKRINIDHGYLNYEESWIEGIGSTFGLFYPSAVGFADLGIPELLCIHVNDTLLYQNPNYQDCYTNIDVGIVKNRKGYFKIFPTIVKQRLNIDNKFNSNILFQYNILNIQGVIVKNGELTSSYIDVSFLKGGIYFIIFYDKNKSNAFVNKFIKL